MNTAKGLLIAAGLASSSAPALAQELTGTLKKIKDNGAITVGHRETLTPFSYYDDKQKVVGYSADICLIVLDAIKRKLKLFNLEVKMVPVTSATRIPLLASGAIDIECGATTNNAERQKQIAYSHTHFVTANKFASAKSANLKTLADLKGKTVVSVSGTTNLRQITELNTQKKLDLNIIAVKDHAEAFLMIETGRAVAFVMDDVILASLIASSKTPANFVISSEPLSVEPYGFMVRKGDPEFKNVVDTTMAQLFVSPKMTEIYNKWFMSLIPPRSSQLNMPMSAELKKVLLKPTDSPDPAAYE